ASDRIMTLLDVSLSIALTGLFCPLAMGIYGRPKGQLPALLAMSFGFSVWFVRYMFEANFVAKPEEVTLDYHVWLSTVHFAPETSGALVSKLAYAWAFVPADLMGLAASFTGYFLGQALTKPPLEKTDE